MRRLSLETRVLDGRAIGGWPARPVASFLDMYSSTKHEKAGEMAGKNFQTGGRSGSFLCVVVLVSPTYPRGAGGPRLGISCDGSSG
jgi:hypothetical protein